MIEDIYNHPVLHGIVVGTVEEQGIEVKLGDSLLDQNQDIDPESSVTLKPDRYYSTRIMENPPCSTDNIVITYDEGDYRVYVIELKSAGNVRAIKREEIYKKFSTIINRFFGQDFSDIFSRDFELEDLCLWLVCDPFNMRDRGLSQEDFDKKVKSCGLDAYASMKPFRYKGKIRMIKPILTPPIIEKGGYLPATA